MLCYKLEQCLWNETIFYNFAKDVEEAIRFSSAFVEMLVIKTTLVVAARATCFHSFSRSLENTSTLVNKKNNIVNYCGTIHVDL